MGFQETITQGKLDIFGNPICGYGATFNRRFRFWGQKIQGSAQKNFSLFEKFRCLKFFKNFDISFLPICFPLPKEKLL